MPGAEVGGTLSRELRSEAPRWTIPGRTALRGTIWSIPYRLSPNTLRGWPRHGSAGCQAQCEAHIHPRYSTASTVQPPVPQGHQQRCRPWQGRQRVWPMGRSRGAGAVGLQTQRRARTPAKRAEPVDGVERASELSAVS